MLVLDADQTSSLAVVRALGRAGIEVHVASSAPHALGACSRYARSCSAYPDPLTSATSFIAWVQARQTTHPDALIFPLTERSLVPLMKHRNALQDHRLAIAPTEALEAALDKSRTQAMAEQLGLAVPRSRHLPSREALARLEIGTLGWGYPVVVKPMRSVGQAGGKRVQLQVQYALDAQELTRLAEEALRYGEVILQEYFQGDGVGVELIADHGQIRHVFQHRRLHEVPLTGGGSSLRISEAVAPVLHDAAARLMRALDWHGVAMVEFKYQRDTGAYRLIEINGRFWGSLPLAVAAGADFPVMLYELMTAGAVAERPPARLGIVCRHLARDLDWLEHVVRRAAPARFVTIPGWKQVLRDWALVASPRHRFDAQSLLDPWPGLVDAGRILRHQARRIGDVLRQRWQLRAAWQAVRARQVLMRQSGNQAPRQVLFLCHGNINRSALAQAWALRQDGLQPRVVSAGFHPESGRPADPVMVEVAARCGADLSDWRSHTVDAALVQQSDLILAMELRHMHDLLKAHPQARGKTFLLGAVAADSPQAAEIPDPYGRPVETYRRVCQQVTQAVDIWLSSWRRA